MTEKNTKLAREWLDKAYGDAEFLTPSLTALLDQKDAEWEKDVREVFTKLPVGPGHRTLLRIRDEILKRQSIQP